MSATETTAPPPSPPPPDDGEKKIAGMHRSTAILGLVAAIVTLAGVVVGVFAGHTVNQNNDLSNQNSGLSSSLSSAQAANSTLSRQLSSATAAESSLSDANASLQAQLSAAPTAAGPSGSAAPTSITERRKTSDLALVDGGGMADLDSKSDPQWRGPEGDMGWSGDTFPYNGHAWIVPSGRKADYNTCYNSTLWDSPALSISALEAGQYFCLKTTEKRYAAIQVLKMTQSRADIAVVVYHPPDTQ